MHSELGVISQRTSPASEMTEAYLTRLGVLLRLASELASNSLLPLSCEQPASEKGTVAQVAFELQGRSFEEVQSIASKHANDVDWTSERLSGRAGSIVNYGIGCPPLTEEIASWIKQKLASVPIEVPVFEAEIAALPISFAERLLKARNRLTSVRSRCELCVRIIAALEGKGRKIPAAKIEKMKLQFEKAEASARKQEEKRKLAEEKALAAEKARQEREKKREEKEDAKSAKETSTKKKQREKKAQSDFMMRFMKKRVTPQKPSPQPTARVISLLSPGKDVIALDFSESEEPAKNDKFQPYRDDSVMSVSLWLRLQMGFDRRDSSLKFLTMNEKPELDKLSLKAHLEECGQQRMKAQRGVTFALKQYRKSRTLNRDDKTPRFATRRSDLRGRGTSGPKQILHFDENHRPGFVGTTSRRSRNITGRRPFGRDVQLNYEVDSEDEWEKEAEDGESLSDVEADNETAREDAELRLLYGSDDESDDDDFLDDEDAEDEGDEEDDEDSVVEVVSESSTVKPGTTPSHLSSHESKVESLHTCEAEKKDIIIDVDALPPSKKRPASRDKEELAGSKKKRRRKNNSLNHTRVEVVGIDYGDSGQPSLLDAFPVSTYLDAPLFTPFDPLKESTNTQGCHTKTLPTQTPRPSSKSNVLDGNAIFELAAMIHGSRDGKEKLVHQFIFLRRSREQTVPTQSEVYRLIGQLTVREKRVGDTRAYLYLKDRNLEAHVNAVRANNASITGLSQGPLQSIAPEIKNASPVQDSGMTPLMTQSSGSSGVNRIPVTGSSNASPLMTSVMNRTAFESVQAPMLMDKSVIVGTVAGRTSASNTTGSSN